MKRKLLFNTNFALLKTGFGRAALCILKHLYATGKYEIFHICGGSAAGDPSLERTPWKSLPAFNSHHELNQIQDLGLRQLTTYGAMALDEIIKKEKIFAFFGVEDFWAFNCFDSPWFNKIHSVIWTTLDSLPLLPNAVEKAPKIKNFWLWSDFATEKFHSLDIKHPKTVYGPIDSTPFYRLQDKEKSSLREKFGISSNAFIAGFVFRNQLRKLVPNALEGFKLFKEQNNIKNGYLLFHTHFSEQPGNSWDIPRLINEYGLSPNEVLVTHICRTCKEIIVQPFLGQDKQCPYCQADKDKGLITTSPGFGATEKQLNDVYNLCNCYLHPMTSGGLEYPLIEAKLTELITITVPYSCGTTFTQSEAQSLALDYAEYREINTHFIKASPYPSSIAKQLLKVYNMKPEKLREMGQKARKWALERFDIKVIGKFIEDFIDNLPDVAYDYKWDYIPRNVDFVPPQIQDDAEWLMCLYKNILFIEEPRDGLSYWLDTLKKGISREQVYQFFIKTALEENNKHQKIDFADLLFKNGKKQLALVQPQSIGDLIGILGILESIRNRYPEKDWNIYMITDPKYFELFEGNKYIDKLLPYQPFFDNCLGMEGAGTTPGYFDILYSPYWRPQRAANYTHNGVDLVDLEMK